MTVGAGELELESTLRVLVAIMGGAEPDSAALAGVTSAAGWSALVETLDRQGLTARMASGLGGIHSVPEATRLAINDAAQRDSVRALQGMAELARLVRALEASAIPVVALKGPAFAQWLYGAPGCRRFGDLDLLVTPDDRVRALAVLESAGFSLPDAMPRRVAEIIYGSLGAWPMQGGGTFPVDLHWRCAHYRFPAPLETREIIEQAGLLHVAGVAIRIPCATHAALLTLLHAAKHLWRPLELVVAIAHLMARDDVDWPEVRRLALRGGGWIGCAAGLILAADLLEARMPHALARESWPAGARRLTAWARESMASPAGMFPDRRAERRMHRFALDRWPQRMRYDTSRLIDPTPLEWRWCRLPARLAPLYVPVRLLRLGLRACSGRLAR